jgi:hypothetical protein
MNRATVGGALVLLAGTAFADDSNCTADQYKRFSYTDPIPVMQGDILTTVSELLACKVSFPDQVLVFSRQGEALGEVRGFVAEDQILEQHNAASAAYLVMTHTETGENLAARIADLNLDFRAPDHLTLTAQTNSLSLFRYNPGPSSSEPGIMGPQVESLVPSLDDQWALTMVNMNAGLRGDPLQHVTFRSEPAGASLWIKGSPRGQTEKQYLVSRSQQWTVKMTLDGYHECNSDHYQRDDQSYNSVTITCRMRKQSD